MAKYSKVMLVFGLGVLVVSMWCMKGTEGSIEDDSGATIHAVRREEPPEGCGSGHTEGGAEQCTDEDDRLGLYADVDDTFKAAIKRAASHFHSHDDADDSSNLAHNLGLVKYNKWKMRVYNNVEVDTVPRELLQNCANAVVRSKYHIQSPNNKHPMVTLAWS
ncbi:unnamed protein product [Sphenostylis stenocarpa]|uniref:Uncharacterized protein n=1 Tax=Sphenostylis stenocarpa TaxID=92480 RepID=A0AA86T7S5_9FABA|nr:unnamed protein product [Sphenostylis stenocarpa]